ncbi:MAG: tetratricopeptide repeat protein [Planctomycetes bacterium]|nr:tetratricopeptide repeat protein [Planctomycetota bacterium]
MMVRRSRGLTTACLFAALGLPLSLFAQAAPSERGQDFYSLNDLGDWKFRRGDYRGALAAYRKAYELDPGSPFVLENLGDTHKSLGESRSAVEAYAEAIRLLDMDPHGGTRSQQRRLHEKMVHYIESQPDLLQQFSGPNEPPFGKSLRQYQQELSRLMNLRNERQRVERETGRLKAEFEAERSGANDRIRDLEREARERQIREELAELRVRLVEASGPYDRSSRRQERRDRLESALGEEESARLRAEEEAERERERWRREIDEQDRHEEELRMRRLSEALSERRSKTQGLRERLRLEQLQVEREAAADRLRGLADEEARFREAERRLAEDSSGGARRDSGAGVRRGSDAGVRRGSDAEDALADEERRAAEAELERLKAEAEAAKTAAEEAEARRDAATEDERVVAEDEARKAREEAANKIMAAAEAEERLRQAEEARAHAEEVAAENRRLREKPIGETDDNGPSGYPYADRPPSPKSRHGEGRVIIQGEPPSRKNPPPGVCPDDPRLAELEALRRRRDELLERLEAEQSSEEARRAEEDSLMGGRESRGGDETRPGDDREAEAEALAAGRDAGPLEAHPESATAPSEGPVRRGDGRLRIPPPPGDASCDRGPRQTHGADLIELTDDTAARDPSGGSIDACLRAVELDPKNWEIWERLGDAYRTQGYRIDAQYAYERAISLRGRHDQRLEAKYHKVKR